MWIPLCTPVFNGEELTDLGASQYFRSYWPEKYKKSVMSDCTNIASWKVKPMQSSLLYQLKFIDVQVYWDVRPCEKKDY
jgi:hypothetical protein